MKRIAYLLTVVVLALGALAPSAAAAGAGAQSSTQTIQNATQSFPMPNPCTGAMGMVTITFNGVFHATLLTSGIGAGTYWATGTQAGTLAFVPNDPSQPSYSGQFAVWFGDNNNLQNGAETVTLNIRMIGTDGSILNYHDVSHVNTTASGMTFSFDKPICQ